ncbi:MAG: hypothetical protein J6252_05565 [Clostridia bacterium]|nr:hypothetical protein [Clostridia bacterium]
MKRIIYGLISSRSGKTSRAVAILLALVFVMLAVVSVPLIRHLRDHSREIGCMAALDTADKELRNAYLSSGCTLTYAQAKETVTRVMNGWDDLCPGDGTVHLVYDESAEMPYRLVCGIHGSDEKERTRLNAQYVFDILTEKIKVYHTANGEYPGSVVVSLNGEELTVNASASDVGLHRGTDYSGKYKGTVAFFAVAGESEWADSFGASKGSVSWFVFADEKHCARWDACVGWSLDNYDY